MIDPKRVTAALVTDGSCDLAPVLATLKHFAGVEIWDNRQNNRKVYGRYLAAASARTEYVYVQDDDCLIDSARLCAEYRPGELLCNMKPSHTAYYKAISLSLVGWGAIFPKVMIDFGPYLARFEDDLLFDRECDRVFTRLNWAKVRMVEIGVEDLPHAHAADRMGREPRHGADLQEIRRRLAA